MNDVAGFLGFVLLSLGVAQCFFGYRIFRFLLGLSGFVVGAALGAMLARNASAFEAILTVLALGVLGATLAVWAYLVGIFLTGAFVGGALGALFGALADSEGAAMGLGLIGGIAGGIIALQVQKFVIVVSTAIQGAAVTVAGATLLMAPDLLGASPERLTRVLVADGGPRVGVWLLLVIAGIIAQYRSPAASRVAESPSDRIETPDRTPIEPAAAPAERSAVPATHVERAPRRPDAPAVVMEAAGRAPQPVPTPRVIELPPSSVAPPAEPRPADTGASSTWSWPTRGR